MNEKNNQQMGMCMEVAGLESIPDLNAGPRMVTDSMGMRDEAQFSRGGQVRRAASGCEAYGMDAD